ncbi:MAG: recombinase family protein [Lachnospiraceae bacterium]|nr:recombinase family protein [Lachnospiraceae bacterium]
MSKTYGYCRISTKKQNIDRQVRNIQAVFPDAIIVKEIYTGTKFQGRNEMNKIIKQVQEGDTIVYDSVSRMSRDADEGFELYKELFAKGIILIFLKEPHINTETYKSAIDAQFMSVKINTNDKDTDNLIESILSAVNTYILKLAEKQIRLAFEQAEKEVQDLRQRTREGIETARLNGKNIGLKSGTKLVTKKSIEAKALIKKYSKDFDGTLNDVECIRMIGIARGSFYKYKGELKLESGD